MRAALRKAKTDNALGEQRRVEAARIAKIDLLETHWFYGTTALQPQLWLKGGVQGKIARQKMKLQSHAIAGAA